MLWYRQFYGILTLEIKNLALGRNHKQTGHKKDNIDCKYERKTIMNIDHYDLYIIYDS